MLFPGGGSATLSGTQLLDVQPDEFTMLVDFNNNPGEYRIRIHSPEDLHSDWFVFDVSPISLLPQITDIKQIGFIEGSPTKARVDIIGSNFLQHAHAVLGIHEPGGTVITTGCTDWAWGLAQGDPAVQQITRTIISRLTAP